MSDKWWMLDADAVTKDKSLNEPLLNKKDDLEAQMGDLDDDDDDDLSLDDSDDEEEGNDENGAGSTAEPEKKSLGARFWYVVTASLGTVGANAGLGYLIVTSAAALTSPIALLPLAAGMFASMTSVFAIVREKKIAGITSLREALNLVRGQVNGLAKQNKRLNKSRKAMGRELKKLKACEEKLTDTVEANGASVDEFVELVEENQEIMLKMKKHFDAKVVQDCVRIIIKFDKDKDFILSSREMPMLIYALKSFDIEIKDDNEFKAALTNKSVSSAIQYVTDLLEAQAAAEAASDKYGLSKPSAMEKYRKIAD